MCENKIMGCYTQLCIHFVIQSCRTMSDIIKKSLHLFCDMDAIQMAILSLSFDVRSMFWLIKNSIQ